MGWFPTSAPTGQLSSATPRHVHRGSTCIDHNLVQVVANGLVDMLDHGNQLRVVIEHGPRHPSGLGGAEAHVLHDDTHTLLALDHHDLVTRRLAQLLRQAPQLLQLVVPMVRQLHGLPSRSLGPR